MEKGREGGQRKLKLSTNNGQPSKYPPLLPKTLKPKNAASSRRVEMILLSPARLPPRPRPPPQPPLPPPPRPTEAEAQPVGGTFASSPVRPSGASPYLSLSLLSPRHLLLLCRPPPSRPPPTASSSALSRRRVTRLLPPRPASACSCFPRAPPPGGAPEASPPAPPAVSPRRRSSRSRSRRTSRFCGEARHSSSPRERCR